MPRMGTRKKSPRTPSEISAFANALRTLSERLSACATRMTDNGFESIETEIKTAETVDLLRIAQAVNRVEGDINNAVLLNHGKAD